jgi:hypothetical protein
MSHPAEEIIERMAREFASHALGEITFLETVQIPRRLGRHFVVAALHRAAVKLTLRETHQEAANGRSAVVLGNELEAI